MALFSHEESDPHVVQIPLLPTSTKGGQVRPQSGLKMTRSVEECPVRSLFCLFALNVGRKDLVVIQIWNGIDSGVDHIASAYQSNTRLNHFQFQQPKLDTVCQP